MSVNIRYPNITGFSDKEQLGQIKSYLHQLVEQLNYALTTIGSGDGTGQSTNTNETKPTGTYEVQGGEVSYYELRSLIIQGLQKVDNVIAELEQARDNGEFDGKDGKTPNISFTMDEDGNLYYEVE